MTSCTRTSCYLRWHWSNHMAAVCVARFLNKKAIQFHGFFYTSISPLVGYWWAGFGADSWSDSFLFLVWIDWLPVEPVTHLFKVRVPTAGVCFIRSHVLRTFQSAVCTIQYRQMVSCSKNSSCSSLPNLLSLLKWLWFLEQWIFLPTSFIASNKGKPIYLLSPTPDFQLE